jgi:hypothetical protein
MRNRANIHGEYRSRYMPFNEDNLRKGLETFTNSSKDRYVKAFENYSAEVKSHVSRELAVEKALATAVKGLPNKDEKLQIALKAAGLTRQQDVRTVVLPTAQSANPPASREKRKFTFEKVRAFFVAFNKLFQRFLVVVAVIAVAIAVGFGLTFLLEGINLAKGNEPKPWIPWVVVPIGFFITVIVFFIRARRSAKRKKERDEHRENPNSASPHPA